MSRATQLFNEQRFRKTVRSKLDLTADIVLADIRSMLDEEMELSDPDEVGSPKQPTTPLAETNPKWRLALGTPVREVTFSMRDSIGTFPDGDLSVGLGASDIKAEWQHFGTYGGGGNSRGQFTGVHIPPRPFMGVSAEALARIESDVLGETFTADEMFNLEADGLEINITSVAPIALSKL